MGKSFELLLSKLTGQQKAHVRCAQTESGLEDAPEGEVYAFVFNMAPSGSALIWTSVS